MDETKTYHWKELALNGKHIEIDSNKSTLIDIKDCDLTFFLPYVKNNIFINTFINKYLHFTISKMSLQLIDTLLENYKIKNLNTEFYLLSAIFQKQYLNYFENPSNKRMPLVRDFQDDKIDFEKLLDILYIKISQGNNIIKSISFKTKKTITLNNFFVVDEVLDTLIASYKLNLENFDKRKQELLELTNNNKLELLDEYHKWLILKSLYNYISKDKITKDKTRSSDIRFAGSFIHISQIPIRKIHFEVPSTSDINSVISINEIKYLNGFLKRSNTFFLK